MCNNDEFSAEPGCVLVFGERGYENGFISIPDWGAVTTSKLCQPARRLSLSWESRDTFSSSSEERERERPAFLFSFNVHHVFPLPPQTSALARKTLLDDVLDQSLRRGTSALLFAACDWKKKPALMSVLVSRENRLFLRIHTFTFIVVS